ncbi:MAG: flagellar basal body protein, partial [Candidatus Competibacteraceae bacterium]|nr:flagellar basal body protein [Candidatus Competibacteraceae bacterium]
MVDFLRTALSGLNASQRSLATTGHNIANVNNPDFSRQRVDLTTDLPQREGGSFIGTGVTVEGIDRVYDSFIAAQIRTHTSTVERFTALDELTAQLDSLVADPDASLAPSLEGFFAAAEDLANDPASVPARQALLSNADSLTARFQDLDRQMDTLGQGIDTSLRTTIAQINGLAQSIGVRFEGQERAADLSPALIGGRIGGLLEFRDQILTPAQNRLGLLAT